MYRITKVEAVNRVLKSIDGTVISTLDTEPQRGSVIKAVQALDVTTDDVQSNNVWGFSMEGPKTLTANDDNEIVMPDDLIHVTWRSWSNGSVKHLTARNGKVYNRKDSNYTIPGQITYFGNSKWAFEECPYPIQAYIVERAKFDYFNSDVHLSPARASMASVKLKDAFTAALKWDSEQNGGMLSQYMDIRNNLYGQGGGGWWNGGM